MNTTMLITLSISLFLMGCKEKTDATPDSSTSKIVNESSVKNEFNNRTINFLKAHVFSTMIY